jgi:hypothetical protein
VEGTLPQPQPSLLNNATYTIHYNIQYACAFWGLSDVCDWYSVIKKFIDESESCWGI